MVTFLVNWWGLGTWNLVKPTNWVKRGILILTVELKQPETLMSCSLRMPGGALADLRAASRRVSRL